MMTTATITEPPKCRCCNNPWAAATADFFDNNKLDIMMCQVCDEGKGLSRRNLDETVNPCDNFYAYSNGGWIQSNPIPPGYPNWNTFLTLHVQSQENLMTILENLEKNKGEGNETDEDEEQVKLTVFYKAAMEEERIEASGVQPLQPLLALIDEIVAHHNAKSANKVAEQLGVLSRKYGIGAFFGTGVSPDFMNSDHNLCQVAQGGLGLPDRDYYFDEDKEEKRQQYKEHVAKMLTLLDDPTATEATEACTEAAEKIYNLELALAGAHMTKTENRDPAAVYNKMSVQKLVDLVGGEAKFDFGSYFVGMGKAPDDLGDVNVRNTAALKKVADVMSTLEPETLKHYLYWHAVSSAAPYLPNIFVEEDFDFYERKLSGTQEMKPRWKRAMAWTEKALGEALGKLFCAQYFDEDCKRRALAIVEQVRTALQERLLEVDWMKDDSTRQMALKKMNRFGVKIGYPNKWKDYSTLIIDPSDDFLSMVFKARAFEHDREVKEMNDKVDREKWLMTPQTVNAYYHPNLNEIVFPAAILQHPFFDKNADDAVNFGSMGAVVGHEMTHGFDDKGRKFNFKGEMNDWWQKADADEYESRVEVMVKQAESFKVHGMPVQGKLTCGENIADLGGLRLAYRALKNTEGFDDSKLIDGFTPTQRFFLAWSQCWRQNITKERSLQLLTLDPHGPAEMRCNGPLSNMSEFHEAFQVKGDDPMYRPAEQRVDIW